MFSVLQYLPVFYLLLSNQLNKSLEVSSYLVEDS